MSRLTFLTGLMATLLMLVVCVSAAVEASTSYRGFPVIGVLRCIGLEPKR